MSAIVRGAVFGQGSPLRGRRVAVLTWSPESSTSMLLAQAFTDRDGRYQIVYEPAAGHGRLAVCVIDSGGRILAASRELSVLPAGAEVRLEIAVTEPDLDATRTMSVAELHEDDEQDRVAPDRLYGPGPQRPESVEQRSGQQQPGRHQEPESLPQQTPEPEQLQQPEPEQHQQPDPDPEPEQDPDHPTPGAHQPPPTTVAGDYTVSGRITWPDGSPVVGVVIRAVDLDLRREQPLGPYAPDFRQETRTDTCGRYRIEYHREQYTRAELGTADLVVRVLGADGKPVAASGTSFNAPDEATVDLTVGGAVIGQPSQWERVVAVVQQVLDDSAQVSLGDLLPTDLPFLTRETGVARDVLSALLGALAGSREARGWNQPVLPEVLFGLSREGLLTDWASLAGDSLADLTAALKKAAGPDGIIPAALAVRVTGLAEAVQQAAVHAHGTAVAQTAPLATPALRYTQTGSAEDPLVDTRLNAALSTAVVAAVNTAATTLALAALSTPAAATVAPAALTTWAATAATAATTTAGTETGIVAATGPSDALSSALTTALTALRWQDVAAETVPGVARTVLASIGADAALTTEAAALSQAIAGAPASPSVSDTLHLTTPVRDNPLLQTDIRQGIAVNLATLAGLPVSAATAVAAHSDGLFDTPATTLDALRTSGALTDAQTSTLATLLDLGNLTDHHATVLQTLTAQGIPAPHDLAAWDAQRWTGALTAAAVQPPPGQSVADYAATLVANLEHTYPTQALAARLLADGGTGTGTGSGSGTGPGSGTGSGTGDQYLSTLYQNNPTLDLRTLDLATATGPETLNWQGIPDEQRTALTGRLAAHQRLIALGPDTASRAALARAGFDSALRITTQTEDAFRTATGLDLGTGRMIYARAHDLALNVAHLYGSARDVLKNPVSGLLGANGPTFINDLLRIQGLADLFGSQDYCRCEDCQSVLSPAAYFVDLMHFIDTTISQPTFVAPHLTGHPLYLKNRRADLWTLRLTCDNTNTLVPYLTIVDKVLEDWINAHALPAGHTDIYTALADPAEKFSSQVPFSLPFAELGLYLGYFSLSPADIYRVLHQPDAQTRRAAAGLSPDEATVVATPDPTGIVHRLGDPATLDLLPVQTLLRRLAITREQLTTLLASRFATDLAAVTVVKTAPSGSTELQNFPEALQNLTAARADLLFRLIRLGRPLSWAPTDLDLVLLSLHQAGLIGTDLTEAAIELVGRTLTVQKTLGITVQQLCALFADMPVSAAFPATPAVLSDRMLYETVFDLRSLFGPADPATPLAPTADYYHYALDTTLGTNPPVIDPKTPLLLAGLGVSETDLLLLFALLKNEMPFNAAGHASLSRHTLSLLYRHVLLARTLGYRVADFVTALALLFPPPTAQPLTTLDQIDALLDFHRRQAAAPFTIPQLDLILTGTPSTAAAYVQTPATVAALVLDIQTSGAQPRTDALRTKLATTFNVGSALLEDMLAWAAHDITAPDITTALNTTYTAGVPDNPAELTPLLDLLHQLERTALLFSTLKLTAGGITYLTATPAVLGIAAPKTLTLPDVQALTAYAAHVASAVQATQTADAETTVQHLLTGYQSAAAFDAPARAQLAGLRQADPSLIDSIAAAVPLPPVAIDAFTRLDEVLALCRTLSVNAYSLRKLGLDDTFDHLTDAAAVAVGAVGAQFADDGARDTALEPYQDRVNTFKRDALCGYLIDGAPGLNFLDHDDIYAYFLLDVDMSGCARTSWVVAALSSLQLYVQRCLAALEQSDPAVTTVTPVRVGVPDAAAEQWEWRKYFRVWQANRKVFLNPESYMDPDLRDGKTPIFTDLEADLLQQPLTTDTGQEAFHRYLTRLADVTHLRICGTYYDDADATYHFFARTQADPPTFYHRTWDTSAWTPWTRIDLTINATWVSAVKHHSRLYLFWTDTKFTEHTSFSNGASHDDPTTTKVGLSYSVQRPDGRWQAPQKLDWLYPIDAPNQILGFEQANLVNMLRDKVAATAYPVSNGEDITLRYLNIYAAHPDQTVWERTLDLFGNQLVKADTSTPGIPTGPAIVVYRSFGIASAYLGVQRSADTLQPWFDLRRDTYHTDPSEGGSTSDLITTGFPFRPYSPGLNGDPEYTAPIQAVNNAFPESVLAVGFKNQQYLVHERHVLNFTRVSDLLAHRGLPMTANHAVDAAVPGRITPGLDVRSDVRLDVRFDARSDARFRVLPAAITALANQPLAWWRSPRQLVRLTTSVVDDLLRIDADNGVDGLLTLPSQYYWGYEYPIGFKITDPGQLLPPDDDPDHIDIRSSAAYGTYFQELFLHLPWMMAHQLNTAGRYEDAMWWYRKLFDPMSTDTDTDRVWRYAGFRGLSVPTLREILTDSAALAAYRDDPFNPFAIARLRPVAFQKAIVMKFVDNLIDWGDSLFAQDTTESINEATMLYVLASEILGPRPVELGDCAVVPADQLTYEAIGPNLTNVSDFLVTLENFTYQSTMARVGTSPSAAGSTLKAVTLSAATTAAAASAPIAAATATAAASETATATVPALLSYAYATDLLEQHASLAAIWNQQTYRIAPATQIITQTDLVFCVPPDDVLAGYWDTVEDRLTKIRNCMNLSGVRRQLALFAPPINPMDLVRARAAGLSIEEAVAEATALAAPAYRFTALIDRARQAAQTVAGFGATLLSALEKKDSEELTLLRSLHERTVLGMTADVKTGQVKEAAFQLQALVEQETNVQNRIGYYQGLIAGGLNGWEQAETVSRTTASSLRGTESALFSLASVLHLIPSAGSPFAMVFGGKDIGPSSALATQAVASLANTSESIATASSVGAGHDRRSQEWQQQLTLAQQELKQVEQQRQAADTRATDAQRELDIHQTQIDQAGELDDFFHGKFSSLGLYTYLARTLTRLHRQAYDAAYQLALAAQDAYGYELDDTTVFIAPDNWESGNAGLLSGERLQLQLQQLENAYLTKNTRRFELSQNFPLSLVDPTALQTLRATGSCSFTVPELLFDVVYPGQYKRLVKSVRLTIPGVTGPYTNIGAKLTLTGSAVRLAPSSNATAKVPVPPQANIASAIATSTALNDAGLFELSFRDERFLPFEGAGAVDSAWSLELPSQLRAFDYATISDAVLQISYTALDDGAFRTAVENNIVADLSQYASTTGLFRALSLRHDFPAAWQQLTHPGAGTTAVTTAFAVTPQMFPYFLSGRTLTRADLGVYLQPTGTAPVDTTGLTLTVDGTPSSAWHVPAGTDLATGDVPVTGPASATWTIAVTAGRIDPAEVADVLLLLRYTAS